MKATLCDVCYSEHINTESRYRVGYTHGEKVDLCEKHKDWAKQFKSREEFYNGYRELITRRFEKTPA